MSAKLKIEDIQKGDQVFFETTGISNHDLYWNVDHVGSNGFLTLWIDEMGYKGQCTIHINDVVRKLV